MCREGALMSIMSKVGDLSHVQSPLIFAELMLLVFTMNKGEGVPMS